MHNTITTAIPDLDERDAFRKRTEDKGRTLAGMTSGLIRCRSETNGAFINLRSHGIVALVFGRFKMFYRINTPLPCIYARLGDFVQKLMMKKIALAIFHSDAILGFSLF
jgi:hypothetical protein